MIWVHLPGLSLEYWDEKTLFTICRALGDPIKVDEATLSYDNGYYARVLVNIDLAKTIPRIQQLNIHQAFQKNVNNTVREKFDIGDHSKEASGQENFTPSTSTLVKKLLQQNLISSTNIVISCGAFGPLGDINDAEKVICTPQHVPLEPEKVRQIAEDNAIEKSMINFIDGKNGSTSMQQVPITSWSRVVQRPPPPSSSSQPKIPKEATDVKMVIHNSISNNKGNIWLFWNQALSTPTVISMSSQMITVDVGGSLISGVHAHVGYIQRRILWSEMEVISVMNKSWLVIGDFNAVVSPNEKFGCRSPNRRAMLDFTTCLDNCELLQAPKTGLQFSWSNCQYGNKRILCCLDRAMFNNIWLQKYADWGYKVGLRIDSDHAPLLDGCANIPKPKNVSQKFQKMWISHPTFMKVVQDCWSELIEGDPAFVFQSKLKKLKNVLREWNWNVFGNVHTQIKEAETKLNEAMQHSDNNPNDVEALEKLVEAQNLHNSQEVHLSSLLKTKSRVKWIKEGAANTNFFHTMLKIRQAKNCISELKTANGEIISDQGKIADELVKFYGQKFKFQAVTVDEFLLKHIPQVITDEDQKMLDVIPEEEKIRATIFSMDPDSSPGPDGFSGCFNRACWHIIKEDVIQAIQFCWRRRYIPKGLNSNFLVLLPKVDGAKTPSQFRPIGLRNVSFKIFTKLITNRMSVLMAKLISPQQATYVKGRIIQQQILLASELVNEMKKKRGGGNVALKLDISQAYDSVSWHFLFQVLQKFGFTES
ncbi:uncharacterized protein LOC113312789 [Papaver somniferum]|uniref:uncharacterized protein LOC113312789 n=1 Tax=Papaver somniferum TaxID=3469 RepID=UPI000E6F8313|nr:uncharacterized protein LOC113312789 [Papaver somniferum]